MKKEIEAVQREVGLWEGVVTAPHRFGGIEFTFGPAEIGHFHPSGLLDLPFPLALRDQLLREGFAERHHFLPESGWMSFNMRSESDIPGAIWLLRLSYLRYRLGRLGQTLAFGNHAIAQKQLEELELSLEMRAAFERSLPRVQKTAAPGR